MLRDFVQADRFVGLAHDPPGRGRPTSVEAGMFDLGTQSGDTTFVDAIMSGSPRESDVGSGISFLYPMPCSPRGRRHVLSLLDGELARRARARLAS
jgi:hypothetical protein